MSAEAPARRRFSLLSLTDGAPTTPLVILFLLNALDELDRSAFNVLTPEIRDAFGLENQGILGVVGIIVVVALGSQVLIGYYADRLPRIPLACAGASTWACFTLLTGLAPVLWVLVVARSFSGVGKAVNDPTHNSLLADFYEPAVRIKVYGFHRAANGIGIIVGSAGGGLLAAAFGWRAPFLVFFIPTIVVVVIALMRLQEPIRGAHERRLMGASDDTIDLEDEPPTFGEAWRICGQVKTVRRIWTASPFLAGGLFGIGALNAIFYDDVFGASESTRGLIAAATEPAQLIGLAVGVPIATRLAARDPGLILKFLAVAATVAAAAFVGMSQAPTLPAAIVMNVLASSVLGVLTPGIVAAVSLALPPRARAMGFSIGALYLLPGVLVLFVIGGIADNSGPRAAILSLVPIFLIGAYILASSGRLVAADIDAVRSSTMARAEMQAAHKRGDTKLLLVKNLDVGYDGVQVLFDVTLEVGEGEIIALLGTNGAGKSTLLKAIAGLLPPTAGAIVFDGRDITYALPHEAAARGISMMPGGRGVFPELTVGENLRMGGWLFQRDPRHLDAARQRILALFPILEEKLNHPAATLSGGQQQMLTLGMAFGAKPQLLMIDELSLGLAPVIVEQLLEVVKAIRDQGTTVIIVEQSVNVALTMAETAYFMEKGEIRFRGPTKELLSRPDILRSVYLKGASATTDGELARTSASQASARPTAASPAAPAADRGRGGLVDPASPILATHELRKAFGGVTAINNLSISLRHGEILGIIGPNGAGKTTLFDLLSGFLVPDSGRIYVDGHDITPLPPNVRSRVGLARSFQDPRLFESLTVRQTIAVALDRQLETYDLAGAAIGLAAVDRAERDLRARVEELIEQMGLGRFGDKFISELSTGSRRIVDLACQIALDPRVILLDEPSSGIAQRETEALGPLLLQVRDATDASMIVIEHNMPLVVGVSDRIIALELGTFVVEGDADHVLKHPDVIASYLGGSDATIMRSGGGRAAGPQRRRRRQLRAQA